MATAIAILLLLALCTATIVTVVILTGGEVDALKAENDHQKIELSLLRSRLAKVDPDALLELRVARELEADPVLAQLSARLGGAKSGTSPGHPARGPR